MLPVDRSKRQARLYYDRLSGIYDWLTAGEKSLIERGVEALNLTPGEAILEIGCGTGTGLVRIAEDLSGIGTILGFDISHQMLLESHHKTHHLVPAPGLLQGDAGQLPIRANSVDAVYCAFTLELFSEEDIGQVLREIQWVLKPNGRLAVVAMSRTPHNLAVKLYELSHRLFPVVLDCRPIPLIEILERSGFDIKDHQILMSWGLPVWIVSATTRQEK